MDQKSREDTTAPHQAEASSSTSLKNSPPPAFKLTHGYVMLAHASDFPSRSDDPKASSGGSPSISKAFWFYNARGALPILLYSNQTLRLIDELPKAYQALAQGDLAFCFKIAENKTLLLTLEVNSWNDKTTLQLKKYFKTSSPSNHPAFQEVDENAWIPTKSSVILDPELDSPQALLHFVLTCCRR